LLIRFYELRPHDDFYSEKVLLLLLPPLLEFLVLILYKNKMAAKSIAKNKMADKIDTQKY